MRTGFFTKNDSAPGSDANRVAALQAGANDIFVFTSCYIDTLQRNLAGALFVASDDMSRIYIIWPQCHLVDIRTQVSFGADDLDAQTLGHSHQFARISICFVCTDACAGRSIKWFDNTKQFDRLCIEQMLDHVEKADIVICSTSAPHYVIHRHHAEQWLAARKNRPMFFVDISVPRNIDPEINELDNAFVYDIDDLGHVVEANKKQREREAEWGEEIIQEEVQKVTEELQEVVQRKPGTKDKRNDREVEQKASWLL